MKDQIFSHGSAQAEQTDAEDRNKENSKFESGVEHEQWVPPAGMERGTVPRDQVKLFTYELDDGPLTDAQIDAIRAASPATNTPEENFIKGLFNDTEKS